MPKITSNTLIKHGMPFLELVLEQVVYDMNDMVITISKEADDETRKVIKKFLHRWAQKVTILEEDVEYSGQLTQERNRQLEYSQGDWILFLDDDDYWPRDQLKLCLAELDKDPEMLAYSITPYQLTDYEHRDISWDKKGFSKFLRKEGLRYIHPWPRDLPVDKNGSKLYWKTHKKVKKLPYRFLHLSNLKDYSFRDEKWAGKYKIEATHIGKLDNEYIKETNSIRHFANKE